MAPRSKPFLSLLEVEILTVISGREIYGLEIVLAMNNAGRNIPITTGSLYPTLKRMREKDLVEYRWDDVNEDGGRRKFYKISENGARSLQQWNKYLLQLTARENDYKY